MVENALGLCFRCSIGSNYLMTLNKSLLRIEFYVGAEVTFSIGQRRGFQNHQGAFSNATSPPPLEWQAELGREKHIGRQGGPRGPSHLECWCDVLSKNVQAGFPSWYHSRFWKLVQGLAAEFLNKYTDH